jgi:hypothetical protein
LKERYCIVNGDSGFSDFLHSFLCSIYYTNKFKDYKINLIIDWSLWCNIDNFFSFNKDINIIKREDFDFSTLDKLKSYIYPIDIRCKSSGAILQDLNFYNNSKKNNFKFYEWDYIILHKRDFLKIPFNTLYGEYFLKNFFLKSFLKEEILNFFKILDNGDYNCVHYRLRDRVYPENYDNEFSNICKDFETLLYKSNKKILLCTDDGNLSKLYVDNNRVFNFEKNVLKKNYNLETCISHRSYQKAINEFEINGITEFDFMKFTLIDFYLMIFSKTLHISNSGIFSQSANKIRNHIIDKGHDITQFALNYLS